MPSSKTMDYDTLEATTSIYDMTDNKDNRLTLRSLKYNVDDPSRLRLCSLDDAEVRDIDKEYGDYFPGSSEELGWLGHFVKKSAHLEDFLVYGSNIFKNCSEESVDRFFEDLGKCNHIKKMEFSYVHLAEIICKLGSVIENSNITHWSLTRCYLGVPEVNRLFNASRDMKRLEELYVLHDVPNGEGLTDLDDDVMAGCIPSLAACTAMRNLVLVDLSMGMKSCAALSVILPRMANLMELDLEGNSINGNCVEVLVRGLSQCRRLHSLGLENNGIGDDGLEVLIQGLPASVCRLDLNDNEVTLARQLPLLRFKWLNLSGNTLSAGGPRVVAASLANKECRLETLHLFRTNIGDEGAPILATSIRSNQRLTCMSLTNGDITETGWDAFSPILCDTSSITATYSSNHSLQSLGYCDNMPEDIETLLELNSDEDNSRVAATKILQTHRHLDIKPFFDRKLDLLPHVVAWLERFAESRLDLKLSSIFEFVRAMPQEVVDGVAGKQKGKKRTRNSS